MFVNYGLELDYDENQPNEDLIITINPNRYRYKIEVNKVDGYITINRWYKNKIKQL
jgi:hypothetical protein